MKQEEKIQAKEKFKFLVSTFIVKALKKKKSYFRDFQCPTGIITNLITFVARTSTSAPLDEELPPNLKNTSS